MKYVPAIVGALTGLVFVASGVVVLFRLVPMPPLPEGSPQAQFMAAFAPTGYLTFVKALEVVGASWWRSRACATSGCSCWVRSW